jgi:hypothetical protein
MWLVNLFLSDKIVDAIRATPFSRPPSNPAGQELAQI